LAFLHFNSVPHEVSDHVISKDRKWAARQFLAYYVVNFAVFLVGVSLKLGRYFLIKGIEKEKKGSQPARLLAEGGGEAKWDELSSVGLLAISLSLSQLVLLFIDYCQRQEDMWNTPGKLCKFRLCVLLGLAQTWYWLYALAVGKSDGLVVHAMVWHCLLLAPNVFTSLTHFHESETEAMDEITSHPSWIYSTSSQEMAIELQLTEIKSKVSSQEPASELQLTEIRSKEEASNELAFTDLKSVPEGEETYEIEEEAVFTGRGSLTPLNQSADVPFRFYL